MVFIFLQCPSCGRHIDDLDKKCICGFNSDKLSTVEDEKKGNVEVKNKSTINIDEPKNNRHSDQLFIKEIDSWIFSFSQEDNCINLGTHALKEFKLKIALEDLEELVEFVYRVTGIQKTIRKLQLSVEELPDLIKKVNRLIEEKRSKVSIEFDNDERQRITELINKKLEE